MRREYSRLDEVYARSAKEAEQMISWCNDVAPVYQHLKTIRLQIEDLKARLKREVYTSRIRRLRNHIAELETIARGIEYVLDRHRRGVLHPASNTGVEHVCGNDAAREGGDAQ